MRYLILLLLTVFFACQSTNNENSNKEKRPNVILILTDDQGYGDVGSHGNSIIQTPHIDAFAQKGIEATNFHVGTTCTPTRAGLLTGRNANRNGTWHTIAGCSILNKEEETIAEMFQTNGYQTAMFGKWHLGDNYPYRPHDRGFQEAFYCRGGGVWQTPDYWLNDYFDDTYYRNGKPEKTEGYCTDVWFKETINYIEEHKHKPFFVYLAPNAAHRPFNVPKEYYERYKDAALTEDLKRFYGMITNLDDNFGQLVQYLEDNELAENTILIYTTDNGTAGGIQVDKATNKKYGYNAGLKGQKVSQYDGGHRVPFYINYPKGGLTGGKTTDELIAHVDVLPTLTALCNLDALPKKSLDGRNCTALLNGEKKDTTRLLVTDTQRNQWPVKGQRPCVMSRDWRLVNGKELYYTKTDVGQTENVAKEYPERVRKMQQFYDEWWASTIPDQHYSPLVLGDEYENPTQITVHDLHTEELLAWNQVDIRRATANPKDGYYTVEVTTAGSYEFTLSRYPLESSLALGASVDEQPATAFRDELPKGEALNIVKGIVEIGDLVVETSAKVMDAQVVLKGDLLKGITKLKSWFVLENGTKIPAYYTQVKRL